MVLLIETWAMQELEGVMRDENGVWISEICENIGIATTLSSELRESFRG